MGLVIDGKQNRIYHMDNIYEKTKESNIDGFDAINFNTEGAVLDWTWNDTYSWTPMSGKIPIPNYKVTVFPATISGDKKSVIFSWRDYDLQEGDEIVINLSDTDFDGSSMYNCYASIHKGDNQIDWYNAQNTNNADTIGADVSWDYNKKTFTLSGFDYTSREEGSDDYDDMAITQGCLIATIAGKENIRKYCIYILAEELICEDGTLDTWDYEVLNFKEKYSFPRYNSDVPTNMRGKYWFTLENNGTVFINFENIGKPQCTKTSEVVEKQRYSMVVGFQYDEYTLKTYNIKIIGNILYSE